MEDVTELYAAHDELERLAYVDPLTDLPNLARLREMIVRAPVGSMLFVIDLDQLADVSEAFGQACGDELTTAVAYVLTGVSEDASLTRLGGDRFGLLAPPSVTARNELAQRITQALSQPVTLPNGLTLQASISMGITTKTRLDMSADEMLRQTNVALTRAGRHHSGVEIYDARNDSSAPHRMMLLGELRRALLDGELDLQYQPAIGTSTARVESVEGLLVWRHPSLGLLSASELTEMVDISNLNAGIVLYSLGRAITDQRTWSEAGHHVSVAINVSGKTLHNAAAVSRMIEVLAEAELPPHAIGLEIDQSQMMLEHGVSQESLTRLADAGFHITIDRFGSGLIAAGALAAARVHCYKFDPEFLEGLFVVDESLLSSVIATCRRRGKIVAAEDVRDETRFRWLVDNDVDRIQGPYVAPTMTATELTAFLSTHGDRQVIAV
jgi:diguanylate cyclase (GGDEF)-like protein